MNEEQKRRVRSYRLDDDLVQMMLAGFLTQELRNVHGISVPPSAIHAAIGRYVDGIQVALEPDGHAHSRQKAWRA